MARFHADKNCEQMLYIVVEIEKEKDEQMQTDQPGVAITFGQNEESETLPHSIILNVLPEDTAHTGTGYNDAQWNRPG